MAELNESPDPTPISPCCAPKQQTGCCRPAEKAACCAPKSASCGCRAGRTIARVRKQS